MIIAGDFTNHKPGRRINQMAMVEILKKRGLVSTCHAIRREPHGEESVPTICWCDRTCDGPTPLAKRLVQAV